MESHFKPDLNGTWYREQDLAWRINEYDEYAVEQAVRVKEQVGEAEVVVLSIGPERVKEALKKALAMGADRGAHILDPASHEKDSFQIASIIAEFAAPVKFDLIFTGMQSQDRGSAQVGVLLGEMLGITAVSTVVSFDLKNCAVTLKRELEGGLKSVVRVSLPALITCQLGLNTPRYPTLPNIMKAKKKELVTLGLTQFQNESPLSIVERIFQPPKRGGGLVLEGDAKDIAARVIGLIRENTGFCW